jgi:FMN-dependent oxidoreductase (nitrilotriacetate monooxygenase family)
MTRRMNLALSIANLGYHYAAWRHPDMPAGGNMDFRHTLHCARLAEQGKFDLIFLADSAAVRDLDNPAIAREMEHQIVKHEPVALLAALSAVTRHIGLVATASATYNEPFNLARSFASLDHMSGGRAGVNLVTGFSIDEARNFGLDAVHGSEFRHERATEFCDVMKGLWDSWDDDAFPRDKATGQFWDRAKLHYLDHAGKHFKVRGPLDVARPPQGHLPVFTAGDSDNAMEFSARCGDVVYGGQPDIESARAYYAAVKGRLAKHGRSPDAVKMLPGIMAFVGRTQQEAQDKFDRMQALIEPKLGLGLLAVNGFPDYTGHDIDGPVPEIAATPGRKAFFNSPLMAKVRREGMTIRQLYEAVSGGFWHLGVVGTPNRIADVMEEWFTTGAADGFNVQSPCIPVDTQDFVELVIPELQRRGLHRREYDGTTLRQRLGLPQAPSRYA